MAGLKPNVFTIPPGENFLARLAVSVSNGFLPHGAPATGGTSSDPLALSEVTILLPTRRACRALQETFLRQAGNTAIILPNIRPVVETEEDAQLLAGAVEGSGLAQADAMNIPPAVSELERRLVLTQFILKWLEKEPGGATANDNEPRLPMSPAQAANLARELAGLMDEIEIEQADLTKLAADLPGEFADHWTKTLDFLSVATKAFPGYLAAGDRTAPKERQNLLLRAEAERLENAPPQTPFVVAGVTGSIPATATLMKQVAALPNGCIVLPGLDQHLDDAGWASLEDGHPEHPQSGLAHLLKQIGVDRHDVQAIQPDEPEPGPATAKDHRRRLISEALRPAATTASWQVYAAETDPRDIDSATENLTYLEAQGAQEEAEAIALILRGAAETPDRTAALVTPDRTLARRVAIRLESWAIRIDDSAGRPLMKTVPGTFLDLILECLETSFSPTAVVALLKHPLTRLGMSTTAVRRAAIALELLAFRQIYLGQGLTAIRQSFHRATRSAIGDEHIDHPSVSRLREDDRAAAEELLTVLEASVAPLLDGGSPESRPFRDLVRAHVEVAEAIARNEENDSSNLWAGEAGDAATHFLSAILEDNSPHPDLTNNDYPAFFRSLVAGEVVRPRLPVHPRLYIWGPFEARLQQADIMILGGLNDGKWPDLTEPDPWINRPMRTGIGLPPPEQRIGFAAHDFSQLAAAPKVYLTRAAKVDGVPTVPSRWILRLEAVLKGFGKEQNIRPDPATGEAWLRWAESRDAIAEHKPVKAPRPRPPVEMRPRRMSVTRIESWLANPYSVFARAILKLVPLDPLESAPDMATRGRIIHQALHRFTVRHPDALPENAADELMKAADDILDEYSAHPRVAAFWRPRLRRFSDWFAATEPARRRHIRKIVTEVGGERTIDGPAGPFVLTARADRMDIADDDRVLIY
ncbi:MAG: double-strand break repair protein AddB, partial [Hyphomicrobiaceae bacterium]